jgi:hypothetical protein
MESGFENVNIMSGFEAVTECEYVTPSTHLDLEFRVAPLVITFEGRHFDAQEAPFTCF